MTIADRRIVMLLIMIALAVAGFLAVRYGIVAHHVAALVALPKTYFHG